MSDAIQTLRDRVRASLGQKLIRSARLLNERGIERVAERGHPIRLAHTRLVQHLDFDGTRLTDLAARAGITKQSAQELVDELVAHGYVTRRPDPEDGRAKRIVYTAKGRRAVLDGLEALGEVETELATAVGARRIRELERLLDRVLAELERV